MARLGPSPSVIELVCGCGAGFRVYYNVTESPAVSCPCCGALTASELPTSEINADYDEDGPEVQIVLFQKPLVE